MSSSLIDLLGEQVVSGNLSQIASQLGTDEETARRAVPAALGTLMGGLAKNTSRSSGAEALFGALQRDHDGGILSDLGGALLGAQAGPGEGILRHVFGEQRSTVEAGLGNALGMDSAKMGQLLAMLAPLVLGALGKAQREGSLNARDLTGMLAGERRAAANRIPRGHGLGGLLDADGDGEIADDVMKKLGSGLLKSFFGKR